MRRIFLLTIFSLLVFGFGVTASAQGSPDLRVDVTVTGNLGSDFLIGGSTGTINVIVSNNGSGATLGSTEVQIAVPAGLTVVPPLPSVGVTCSSSVPGLPNTVGCSTVSTINSGGTLALALTVIPVSPASNVSVQATVTTVGDLNTADNTANSALFSILAPTATPSATPTATPTATNTPTAEPRFDLTLSHTGTAGIDFLTGSSTGRVTLRITNTGLSATTGTISATIFLRAGLTINGTDENPNFTCSGTTQINCTSTASIPALGGFEDIAFFVNAPTSPSPAGLRYSNTATVTGGGTVLPVSEDDPISFAIVSPTATPTITPTPSITRTPTITPTPSATRTATRITLTFPVSTFTPTTNPLLVTPTQPTPTLTPTFIPPPASRTPIPRPANAGQAVPMPGTGVRVVTNRDGVNVRLVPAIGATVVGTVNAGYAAEVEARSADNQWVRIDFAGQEGWIGFPVITVIEGDLNNAPIADPRTIPYGGWENPRAGITSVTSQYTGRLANSGLRVRSGPSQGYPVLANAPRYTVFSLLGRTRSNNWVQVNFEGTLGWVASQFVEFQQGLGVLDALPIGGIVADGVPVSDPTTDSLNDTLTLLLARVNIAQTSLDEIRAIWTQIAIGNRVTCGNYPARPSDYNIPLPLLSAFSATLTPLEADFNQAMAYLRAAIDAFIDICSRPQPAEGFVGSAVVTQALDAINAADSLMASLRERLTPLVTDANRTPSEDECRFTYNGQSEIVPRLRIGQVRTGTLSTRRYVRGFCFDGAVGQSLRIEIIRTRGNVEPRVVVAPFTNPTQFIGSTSVNQTGGLATISPLLITQTGQYIVIVSDLEWTTRTVPIEGEFAILLTDVSGAGGLAGQSLAVDAQGNVIITTPTVAGFTPGAGVFCPSITFTCQQLASCDQARACLAAGNTSLDPDFDGFPCEEFLCLQPTPTWTIGRSG